MTFAKFSASMILVTVIGATAPVYAQQSDAASAAPTATAPAAEAPKGPSADTIKKAKYAGFRAKLKSGQTVFCKEVTPIGTRFPEEHCLAENQLLMELDREQAARDSMGNHSCSSGGACSGK
jgi:hypothetical protein